MASDNITNTLPIVRPDYNSLKEGFVQYLQLQPEYTDYNFEGSGLSVITRVHAYNSHFLAFLLNQVANEAFLSTAIKRESVIKKAKSFTYFPKTIRSSAAIVQFEYIPDDVNAPFTPFTINTPTVTTNFSNKSFVFSSGTAVTVNQIGSRYVSSEVKLYEGYSLSFTAPITQELLDSGFTIPNANVDSTSIIVYVTENNITTQYQFFDNIIRIASDDKIYYLTETDDKKLKIDFGDDVLGHSPILNSTLRVEYRVTTGEEANGIDSFKSSNTVTNGTLRILTVGASTGGTPEEDIESIRKNAPLKYVTQNRAVIADDYKSLLVSKFSNIDDVNCFGGEDLDPPRYGKVVIAVKPKTDLFLTTYDKNEITTFIKKYNVIPIIPEIIEPDYVYINVNSKVKYDYSKLLGTESELLNRVLISINDYETLYLDGFDRDFRYSAFVSAIDLCDNAIVSNTTSISLEKKTTPQLGGLTFIETSYNNPIKAGSVYTSTFTYGGLSNCFIDDTSGVLNVYRYTNNIKTTIAANMGTVDYTIGLVSIPSIVIDSLDNANNVNPLTNERYLSIFANTDNTDMIADKLYIIQFNTKTIKLEKI